MSKRVTISIVMDEDVIGLVDNYANTHMRSRSNTIEKFVRQGLAEDQAAIRRIMEGGAAGVQQKEDRDGICS